jgi:hypothetical protein
MKVVKSFTVLILLTIFLGCEDSLTPIIPTVLMETSFEEGTEPSLNGWRDEYPIYGYHKAKFSFSSDTPPNGGQWALKTIPPDSTFTVLRYSINPEQINNNKNFTLSFWSKTNLHSHAFSISFITYSGNHSFVEPAACDSSDWKFNTFNYSSTESSIDRIVISIAMYANADTSKFVLFDNFHLAQY